MRDRARVMGWGYQGRAPDELRDALRSWRAATVVDVRLNPVSRKRGFSRKALAELCDAEGVNYIHLPALGNPRDNRDGFGATGPAREAAHVRYADEVLASGPGQGALAQMAELTAAGLVVVLCFEAAESQCHRRLVLDAIHELVSA